MKGKIVTEVVTKWLYKYHFSFYFEGEQMVVNFLRMIFAFIPT